MLWAAIGPSIHKNYETPTPVRNSTLFFPIPFSLLTLLLGSVLVLDQPSLPGRTTWWGIRLAVDRIICFGNTIHPAVFLGGRFLVGRRREQLPLVETRSEGRIHTEASYIGNASVSNRFSSHGSHSQIFGHQLPPGILRSRPSSLCTTIYVFQSPLCTVGGYLFWRHDVPPLRYRQCPPVSDYQTRAPPPPPSRGTPRARNGTGTSRY
jgi:hypothetical protein